MTTLDRRDRRRGLRVLMKMWTDLGTAGPIHSQGDCVSLIAAALKREREETGFKAVNYFFMATAMRRYRTGAVVQILGKQPERAKRRAGKVKS